MFVIGLTGNSGSGKSTVSQILQENGAYIIDADRIARQVLDGAAYREVTALFGTGILQPNGRIDRKVLGKIVFSDTEKRKQHIQITHKYIVEKMKEQLDKARQEGYALAVMDAPLLVEAKLHLISDSVWLVKADRRRSIERVMERDQISREMAEQRLLAQPTPEILAAYAHVVIENDGNQEELARQVKNALGGCLSKDG